MNDPTLKMIEKKLRLIPYVVHNINKKIYPLSY